MDEQRRERRLKAKLSKDARRLWAETESVYGSVEAMQDPEPVVTHEPVHKGAEAFAKIDTEAKKLRPDLYQESPSRARSEVAKLRPDLRDEYHRATAR